MLHSEPIRLNRGVASRIATGLNIKMCCSECVAPYGLVTSRSRGLVATQRMGFERMGFESVHVPVGLTRLGEAPTLNNESHPENAHVHGQVVVLAC